MTTEPTYLNRQKYQECQLVTAINAAIFLGEPPVERESAEYERLVNLVGARNGAAVCIEKAFEHLGICRKGLFKKKYVTWTAIQEKITEGHPIELSVYDRKLGLHSVMLSTVFTIAIKPPKGSVSRVKFCKVLNFTSATRDAVIPWKALRPMLRPGTKNGLVAWYFYRDFTRGSGKFIRAEDEPDVPYYMAPAACDPLKNSKRKKCRHD